MVKDKCQGGGVHGKRREWNKESHREERTEKSGREREWENWNNRIGREDHRKRRQGNMINQRETPIEQEKKIKQLNN